MATIPPTTNTVSLLSRVEDMAFLFGRNLLGTACLLTGIAMTLTLILLPIGVPVALIGVAMLLGSDDKF